jgi:hypothetical protein
MKTLASFVFLRLPALAGWIGVAAVVAFAASAPAAAQCALCRDAVASSSSETREAMNYAIIGLALTPYGVAALAAWVLSPAVREQVRSRMRRWRAFAKGRSR